MAEVRAATDSVKDPWAGLIEALANAKAREGVQPATAPTHPGPKLTGMSPWLVDTMKIIDTHRQSALGDIDAQMRLLDTAEMLASFLVDIEPRRRPQLNIDAGGQPSFATALDDFYIHLTVDEPNLLTWYATVRGAEHFDEDVAFDGRKLPANLKQLFSL
jgi:hypothetical protein